MSKNVTLATLPTATAQEVFNTVVRHARKQGSRCVDPSGACVYSDGHGMKCFAGALMTDKEWNYNFEEKSWDMLVRDCFVPAAHQSLITRFQRIHDAEGSGMESWEERFKEVAYKFHLRYRRPRTKRV